MTEDKTVAKLESLLDRKMAYFDEEEVVVLRRVIHFMRGLDALGSFAGFVQKSIAWFGVVIGGFLAFKTGLLDPIMEQVTQLWASITSMRV